MHPPYRSRIGLGDHETVQAEQGFRAGVVLAGDGEHARAGHESAERGRHEHEREAAVVERLKPPGPDPGCTGCGDAGEGRDGVDDETPFLVGLEGVDYDVGEVRDQDGEGGGAQEGGEEGEGDAG